jgi:hypothetical protein
VRRSLLLQRDSRGPSFRRRSGSVAAAREPVDLGRTKVAIRLIGYTERVPDVATWIALAIGIYGGGLSTYTAVTRRQESKRELARGIDVVVRTRVLAGPPTVPVTAIHAHNRERRPVQIVRAGALMTNGLMMWHGPETPGLPATLGDGESVEIHLPDEWFWLIRGSTRAEVSRLAVSDAGGTLYFSDPRGLPPPDAKPAAD